MSRHRAHTKYSKKSGNIKLEIRSSTTQADRIAKVIARSGLCSRREAERLIISCNVKVNNKILLECGVSVTSKAQIEVNNQPYLQKLQQSCGFSINKEDI